MCLLHVTAAVSASFSAYVLKETTFCLPQVLSQQGGDEKVSADWDALVRSAGLWLRKSGVALN